MRWGSLGVCGFVALLVAACATPKHVAQPLPPSAPSSVAGLAAAIQANADRSEHEQDGSKRAQLADEALSYADACMAKDPHAAGCLYGRGLALGLQARSNPTHFNALLKSMLESLQGADAADPTYDNAGPARVRAQVLLNAPGWPVGPGDADAGLAAARRAVELRPQYPPNLLTLAQAQAKNDDAKGARETYSRALEVAQGLPPGDSRDGWIRQADQGLQRQ
jgi:hypothetical protein